MANLITVKTFLYRHEAEIAKGLLKEKNIEAVVLADDAGGSVPNASFGMGNVRLLVHDQDAAKAEEALRVLETNVDNPLWEEDATSLPETKPDPAQKQADFTAWPLVVIVALFAIIALIYFLNR
jgi:hypothetical protein